MAVIWSIFSVSCSILVTPFLMFLLAIIFLASIGKSLGVRRLYVKILLKIFEDSKLKFCSLPQYPPQSWGMHFMSFRYGRESIEIAQKDKQDSRDNSDDEDEGDKEEKEAKHDSNGTNHIQVGNHISSTNANNVNHNLKIEKQLKNGVLQNSSGVISREDLILAPDPEQNYISNHGTTDNDLKISSHLPRRRSFETLKREFELSNCLDYIKAGVEAIIEDQVTLRFEAEELKSWNLLTRTNRHYEFISWRLSVIWMVGFLMRYFFLLPLRILICFFGVMWLTICTAIVGYVPEGKFKRWLNHHVSIMCFGVLSSALSAVINYHNPENRPKRGICVANHTSPIDVLVLACDNCYSLIGQRHGGFLGVLQRALARASPHIWFERSEVKDREAVARRLREHVSDPNNPPILIFPEGTCINNTSVMQFKKGSFEVGSVIYPVAIKYDPKFGDAFWNSSRYSMMQYLYMMMSSWAIVCDVWYLPPMYQQPGESAIDFANRVKSAIARQGGLVDLMWDGQLKRMKAKPEWKEKQQEEFSKRLKVE